MQVVIRLLANREHLKAELVRKLAARCVVSRMHMTLLSSVSLIVIKVMLDTRK